MAKLTWTDSDEIGCLLREAHPGVDPLRVRFTDLHDWVVALPGFTGDPGDSSEGLLESIQAAWLAACED